MLQAEQADSGGMEDLLFYTSSQLEHVSKQLTFVSGQLAHANNQVDTLTLVVIVLATISVLSLVVAGIALYRVDKYENDSNDRAFRDYRKPWAETIRKVLTIHAR